MRTVICPDCGETWTCPISCYPGSHAVDSQAAGPEYCRRCAGVRLGVPGYAKNKPARNWHGKEERSDNETL